MKNKRIILSTTLLVICIGVLSVASYAWFTVNQTVSLSQLDINVESTGGIEVSSDAFNWKKAITTDDLTTATYTGNRNQLPTTLKAVSSPKTLTGGLLDLWSGVVDDTTGDVYLTTSKLTDPSATGSGTNASSTTGEYIVFDIFVNSNSNQDLKITTTSNVINTTTDNGLKNAVRVAVINQGVAATPENARTLSNGTVGNTWLWEPNANVHTSQAVIEANSTYLPRYAGNVNGSSVLGGYDAIKANINLANNVPLGATASTHATYFTYLTTTTGINLQTTANTAGTSWSAIPAANDNVITTLQDGINKLRIYVWIEGQDVDCENNAAGMGIAVNLGFTIN